MTAIIGKAKPPVIEESKKEMKMRDLDWMIRAAWSDWVDAQGGDGKEYDRAKVGSLGVEKRTNDEGEMKANGVLHVWIGQRKKQYRVPWRYDFQSNQVEIAPERDWVRM